MRFLLVSALAVLFASARVPQKVLVTAPPAYAERLAAKLARLDCIVCCAPTVETRHFEASSPESAALRAALENDDLDIIAFTSRRGIEAALAAAPDRVDGAVCCALGADRELLDERSCADVIAPADASPTGLVRALEALVPREKRGATTVCAPVPIVRPPLLEPPVVPNFIAALRGAGFRVKRVAAYETVSSRGDDAVDELRSGGVDVLAVSSTAEVDALLRRCDPDDAGDLFANVDVVAHGPTTADGVHRAGLTVAETNLDYQSFDGFVDTIEVVLQRRRRRERTAALAARIWLVRWLGTHLVAANRAQPPS